VTLPTSCLKPLLADNKTSGDVAFNCAKRRQWGLSASNHCPSGLSRFLVSPPADYFGQLSVVEEIGPDLLRIAITLDSPIGSILHVLMSELSDWPAREYYLSGPPGLVSATRGPPGLVCATQRLLTAREVPITQIRTDPFGRDPRTLPLPEGASSKEEEQVMKAGVYYGPRDIRVAEVDPPVLTRPHEMLVRVRATSICGSDLHIWRGALDAIMERGKSRIGHELSGEVVEVGSQVGNFRPGDRVTMAYSVSCGECYQCRLGNTAHCETSRAAVYGFGKLFGDLNGTQAEYLIIPHADAHALRVDPALSDAQVLTLSCNLPTALLANRLLDLQPGDSLAVVGLGPTGLMSLQLALRRGPSRVFGFDPVDHRRGYAAQQLGVETFPPTEEAVEAVKAATGGRGVDRVIEMVGTPESLDLALRLVRAGGTIAALGVFTDNTFNLNLADVFFRDITLHMHGFASVYPLMWEAQRLILGGVIDPEPLFTHRFSLKELDKAYRTFGERSDGVLKVLITPD
jgi:threonine dehydrogenase-like Zn-dependent dehydrogenase